MAQQSAAVAPPERVGTAVTVEPADSVEPASPTSTEPESPTEADLLMAAALSCDGVAAMSAGAFGEVRSLLPGRSVTGIRVDDDAVGLHVVARYGQPMSEVAAQIGYAVAPLMHGRKLRVTVEDILLPGETLNDDSP